MAPPIVRKRIKKARQSHGYSQKKLAELLGVSESLPSHWEIGRNDPSLDDLVKMAKIFDCSVGYFFGEDARRIYPEGTPEVIDAVQDQIVKYGAKGKPQELDEQEIDDLIELLADLLKIRSKMRRNET